MVDFSADAIVNRGYTTHVPLLFQIPHLFTQIVYAQRCVLKASIPYRTDLVNFVSAVCKCLPLSDTTRHLAILLLDHFMEKHDIMDYRLKLVGLTCLLVAAKMEDRDEHLPSIGQLRRLAKLENRAEYSREEFHRMELYLMK